MRQGFARRIALRAAHA